nr:hypothetical protein [Tanacetum cinerariifolium]
MSKCFAHVDTMRLMFRKGKVKLLNKLASARALSQTGGIKVLTDLVEIRRLKKLWLTMKGLEFQAMVVMTYPSLWKEITPPLGFSTIPITTTMFAATTPENTPMDYRASTSTNPNPVISLAFVKANYEALESLLRDRRRQMRNNDLRTELEYFNKDYNEEREMDPRPEPTRAATPPFRVASPRIPHLGRGENGQPLQSSLTFAYKGQVLQNNIRGNLLSSITFLSHHAQPFIPASLSRSNGFMPTHIHPYQQPTSFVNGQYLSFPSQTLLGNLPIRGIPAHLSQEGHAPQTFTNSNMPSQNGFTHPVNMPTNSYPFYTQPMYTFPNVSVYTTPNLISIVGTKTPFVCWIEDYPLLDGLKFPSHIGSYDGKGDPDNFLHRFEWFIQMKKWLMPVACHMFTYTLKDSVRIWWNSQKAGSILDYEDLKAKLQSYFSQQKKFTKTHLAVHNIKQREGESTRSFITKYIDDTSKSWVYMKNNESLVSFMV